jgi:DNA-binding LacI/PurR family transcriptional regulator
VGGRSQEPVGASFRHPTIRDIAARAGVSKSLVSRALRGDPEVAPARRSEVQRIARELGYRPNSAARTLVQRRSHAVGVLVNDLHNPFFPELLDGVFAEAASHGMRPPIVTGARDPRDEASAIDDLLELRPDGIVLASPMIRADAIEAASRRVPLVVTSDDVRVPGIDIVRTDDAGGARLAVDHLVGLGHAAIAAIAGPDVHTARQRLRGYVAAMRDHGLGPQVRIVRGDHTEEGGRAGALALLADGSPPTAILAPNDLAALGVLHALATAGLAVPGDVSVIGFDDIAIASLRHIDLTTVAQQRAEIGALAVRRLVARLANPTRTGTRTVLAASLVERSTTEPPSRAAFATA